MTTGSAPKQRTSEQCRQVSGTVAFVALLPVLEALTRGGIVHAPPPTVVFAEFLEFVNGDSMFWGALGVTAAEMVLGFLLGALIALPLGLLIGRSRLLTRATASTRAWLALLPVAAIVPVVGVAGRDQFAITVGLVAFFTALLLLQAVIEGLQSVNQRGLALAHSYGLTRWQIFRRITLPSALPRIVAGLRQAVIVAIAVALMAELVLRTDGLGALTAQFFGSGLDEQADACILAILLLALLLRACVYVPTSFLARWPETRQPHPSRARLTLIPALALPVVLVAAWFATAGWSVLVPTPIEVLASLVNAWFRPRGLAVIVPDLAQLLLALALAFVIGIALAFLVATSSFARALLGRLGAIAAVVPAPLWVMLAVVGVSPLVVIIAGCVWPVFLQAYAALDAIDPVRAETSRVFRIRGLAHLRAHHVPVAMPGAFRGLRESLLVGLNLMVLTGIVVTHTEFGGALGEAVAGFSLADAWAGVILLGTVSCLLAWLVRIAERRTLRWNEVPDANL